MKDPILTSIHMGKLDDFSWEVRVIETQGDKVIKSERIGKPNLRAIIEENFKKEVVRLFFNKGR